MNTITVDGAVVPSLRTLLGETSSRWAALARGEATWTDSQNSCVEDILDRFDDCPESLRDFDRSDWVNMAECYTSDLLNRWDKQREDIKALFDDYCSAIGATSTLEALEGETIEDPEDMAAAIVNHAMTWAARCIAQDLWLD